MTKKQAKEEFLDFWGSPWVKSMLATDKPALREAWNNFTDSLCKHGRITASQYDRWLNPFTS